MRFVIVDESTVTDTQYGGKLLAVTLNQIASAIEIQLNRDVSASWGGNYTVRAASSKTDIQPGEIVAAILDSLPQTPGAVAYHDVSGAEVPFILLARDMCNSLIVGPNSVSVALSHELCETAGDPFTNTWRDDGTGTEWAQELCDATQEDTYVINSTAVSNFVLPAFFATGAKGPYTYLGSIGQETIGTPFATAAGGYQIKRSGTWNQSQVNGTIRNERLAKKRHWSSRTFKRHAQI